jgi:hypothetical protein
VLNVSIVIGETAALVVAVVIYFPHMRMCVVVTCLLSSADLAACPSLKVYEERWSL